MFLFEQDLSDTKEKIISVCIGDFLEGYIQSWEFPLSSQWSAFCQV